MCEEKKTVVYHGGAVEIKQPEIELCRSNTDFGKGFYVTKIKGQAERWAARKANPIAIVNVYAFSIKEEVKLAAFDSADMEWIDFIKENRVSKEPLTHSYDIVEGPVADDRMFAQFNLYLSDLLTKEELLSRVRFHTESNQISFHTEKALRCLEFLYSFEAGDQSED